MIRNITRRYFEVWGNEEAQNSFLKGLLITGAILFAIQSIVLAVLAFRKPTLIAVGQGETRIFTVAPLSEELLSNELKRLVKKYVETHYNWDSSSVEKAHSDAAKYVSEKFVNAFNRANAEQVRFAKEKRISQKVFLTSEIQVDSKTLVARISMERIFNVDGLRATSPLVLDVSFEYGPRTANNPEGIYITAEKVIPNSTGG